MENMVLDLTAISAEIVITVTALLILLADLFTRENQKILLAVIAVIGILLAGFFSFQQWNVPEFGAVGYETVAQGDGEAIRQNQDTAISTMGFPRDGSVLVDNFSVVFRYIFLLALLLSVIMSVNYLKREEMGQGEYFSLMFISTLGMMVMASAADLITLFVGLETLSIPLYALCGYQRNRIRSNESSMKYLIMGAFASSFLLYGMAFMYGATGSLRFNAIAEALASGGELLPGSHLFVTIGVVLMLIGFAFKVSAVPFHMWTPDVYQGAPTPVTAFMSVAVKAAAFAGLLRVFFILIPFEALMGAVADAGWWLAVLTMFVGNIVALNQKNIKRMLAYSSIAHAGYLLVGFMAVINLNGNPDASQMAVGGIVFYLIAYTVMNIGAFAIVMIVARKGDQFETIDDFAGLAKKHPALSAAMTLFMLSLAGFPPTAGFFGKFYLFTAAVQAGLVPLVVIAVINSLISVVYYLGPVMNMYFKAPGEEEDQRPALSVDLGSEFVLYFTSITVLLIGLLPSRLLSMVQSLIRIN